MSDACFLEVSAGCRQSLNPTWGAYRTLFRGANTLCPEASLRANSLPRVWWRFTTLSGSCSHGAGVYITWSRQRSRVLADHPDKVRLLATPALIETRDALQFATRFRV